MIVEAHDNRVRANGNYPTRKAFIKKKPGSKWKLRFRVFKRDEFTCQYCGLNLVRDIHTLLTATVDHVQPRCEGGANAEDNLVTACGVCNSLKAGTACMTFADARALVLDRRAELIARHVAEATDTGVKLPKSALEEDAALEDAVQLELLSVLARFGKTAKQLTRNIDGMVNRVKNVEDALAKAPTARELPAEDTPLDLEEMRKASEEAMEGCCSRPGRKKAWPAPNHRGPKVGPVRSVTPEAVEQAEGMLRAGYDPKAVCMETGLGLYAVQTMADNLDDAVPKNDWAPTPEELVSV